MGGGTSFQRDKMTGSDKIYPDVCAEIGAGGGFMCYRWCYSLCW